MTPSELRDLVRRLHPLLRQRLPSATETLDRAQAEPFIRRLLDRILSSVKKR